MVCCAPYLAGVTIAVRISGAQHSRQNHSVVVPATISTVVAVRHYRQFHLSGAKHRTTSVLRCSAKT